MSAWYSSEGGILSLGAQWIEEERAYSFSLCSQHAAGVTLLLFGEDDPAEPLLEHRLDPRVNKTWQIWHCRLRDDDVHCARYYAYKVDGPRSSGPRDWHAFDPQKVLLDPYAKAVFLPPGFDRQAAKLPGPNVVQAPLGILPRPEAASTWGDVRPPRDVVRKNEACPVRRGGPLAAVAARHIGLGELASKTRERAMAAVYQ